MIWNAQFLIDYRDSGVVARPNHHHGAWVGSHHVDQVGVLFLKKLATLAVFASRHPGNQAQRSAANEALRSREGTKHLVGHLATSAHRSVREIRGHPRYRHARFQKSLIVLILFSVKIHEEHGHLVSGFLQLRRVSNQRFVRATDGPINLALTQNDPHTGGYLIIRVWYLRGVRSAARLMLPMKRAVSCLQKRDRGASRSAPSRPDPAP